MNSSQPRNPQQLTDRILDRVLAEGVRAPGDPCTRISTDLLRIVLTEELGDYQRGFIGRIRRAFASLTR